MNYQFKGFTAESFRSTEEAWISSSENLGIPSIDFEKSLEYALARLDYESNKDSYVYGIFPADSDEAVALVDVIYSTKVKDTGWIKMLNVTFNPVYSEIDPSSNDGKFEEKIDIYAETISGTISLTNHHQAKIVKLFGRNDSLMSLFHALNYHLKKLDKSPMQSKIEGRWLVISTH